MDFFLQLLTLISLLRCILGAAFDPSVLLTDNKLENDKRKVNELKQIALKNILQQLDVDEEAAKGRGEQARCTRTSLQYRMEFASMKEADRKAYTDAVTCFQGKKARTPSKIAPGARGRFDDFVVEHIMKTPFVHLSGTFLSWHRYYIHIYSEGLRNECNYTGPVPYWDWPLHAHAPQESPLFNGDEYSLGSNGEYIPNHPGIPLNVPFGPIPPGQGGGCIMKGPFKNFVANLGPIVVGIPGPMGGFGYNPRCLKRDIGAEFAMRWTNWSAVADTFQWEDIGNFQNNLQKTGASDMGVHGGGHYTISGDPGGDFFASPGDPAFYLHHAQVDRLWTIWQGLDLKNRQYKINGTNTINNEPPSEDTKLTDLMNLGYAGGSNLTVHDAMSTVKGPFCYVYI